MARDKTINNTMLPADAPLAMPEQQFARAQRKARDPSRPKNWISRAAITLATGIVTLAFAAELYGVLSKGIITPLQVVFLILSTLAFAWIALGTLSSALGFIYLYAGETPDTIELPPHNADLKTRTALLFPVYKEKPADVAGTIEALTGHLQQTGQQQKFDVFVLSDTPRDVEMRNGGIERATFTALKHRLSHAIHIFYRRRGNNSGKKSGNIKNWVERFGARYDHFVILDADSVMSGQTLVRLVHAMEHTPNAGLIQTVPKLAGAKTLFQRLQQFASNVYGPSSSAGLAAWHGDEGNYWGHNAIIRTLAFAGTAGLPVLKGKAPFGGDIQSHDFVEAALLARSGWAVHMAPTVAGSFEGSPPNLPELVARDRRWAQGNLQHLSILRARGLTMMGRTHLAFGAMSYIIAMVWAGSLVVGILLALQGSQMIPTYFADEKTLFPIWPVTDPRPSLMLFLATITVVLLPKVLGGVLEVARARTAREVGAIPRTIAGVTVETIFSMLLAPILLVTQTTAVLEIIIGRDSGWNAQTRNSQSLGILSAQRAFMLPALIGLATTATCLMVSLELTAWMAPILLGTILAGPLAWFTARPSTGLLSFALSTPQDRTTPAILDHTHQCQTTWAHHLTNGNALQSPPMHDQIPQAA